MRVRLKTAFIFPGGGSCFPGDVVNVDNEVGDRLLRTNAAENADHAPVSPVPAPVGAGSEDARAVKPVVAPAALRGDAKKEYLRGRIVALGGTPIGNTIAALNAEYAALASPEADG